MYIAAYYCTLKSLVVHARVSCSEKRLNFTVPSIQAYTNEPSMVMRLPETVASQYPIIRILTTRERAKLHSRLEFVPDYSLEEKIMQQHMETVHRKVGFKPIISNFLFLHTMSI